MQMSQSSAVLTVYKPHGLHIILNETQVSEEDIPSSQTESAQTARSAQTASHALYL
jgi:hypothetical protein